MKKINYQSDFEIVCTWVGETEIIPFVLEYKVGCSIFTASYNGKVWRNCEKIDDSHIRVRFDNHNFKTGKLHCKMTYWLDNEHYLDGKQTVVTHIDTDIELVNGNGDDVINDLHCELSANYQRGFSAYEIAQQNGFEGTEEEWLASLAPALVEDETNGACLVINGRKFKLGEEVVETPEDSEEEISAE